MISNRLYDDRLTRTISVDIRYVLFVIKKFAKADFLLEEMGLRLIQFPHRLKLKYHPG